MRYAMTLCSATHPDSECASQAAKKYVRLGASPRAGQALISAAKVKALMKAEQFLLLLKSRLSIGRQMSTLVL